MGRRVDESTEAAAQVVIDQNQIKFSLTPCQISTVEIAFA
jgi:hypothetical protein